MSNPNLFTYSAELQHIPTGRILQTTAKAGGRITGELQCIALAAVAWGCAESEVRVTRLDLSGFTKSE